MDTMRTMNSQGVVESQLNASNLRGAVQIPGELEVFLEVCFYPSVFY